MMQSARHTFNPGLSSRFGRGTPQCIKVNCMRLVLPYVRPSDEGSVLQGFTLNSDGSEEINSAALSSIGAAQGIPSVTAPPREGEEVTLAISLMNISGFHLCDVSIKVYFDSKPRMPLLDTSSSPVSRLMADMKKIYRCVFVCDAARRDYLVFRTSFRLQSPVSPPSSGMSSSSSSSLSSSSSSLSPLQPGSSLSASSSGSSIGVLQSYQQEKQVWEERVPFEIAPAPFILNVRTAPLSPSLALVEASAAARADSTAGRPLRITSISLNPPPYFQSSPTATSSAISPNSENPNFSRENEIIKPAVSQKESASSGSLDVDVLSGLPDSLPASIPRLASLSGLVAKDSCVSSVYLVDSSASQDDTNNSSPYASGRPNSRVLGTAVVRWAAGTAARGETCTPEPVLLLSPNASSSVFSSSSQRLPVSVLGLPPDGCLRPLAPLPLICRITNTTNTPLDISVRHYESRSVPLSAAVSLSQISNTTNDKSGGWKQGGKSGKRRPQRGCRDTGAVLALCGKPASEAPVTVLPGEALDHKITLIAFSTGLHSAGSLFISDTSKSLAFAVDNLASLLVIA